MVVVPIQYLYASRNTLFRGPTIALGVIWGVLCLIIVYRFPETSYYLAEMSLISPAYYISLSLWVNLQYRR